MFEILCYETGARLAVADIAEAFHEVHECPWLVPCLIDGTEVWGDFEEISPEDRVRVALAWA